MICLSIAFLLLFWWWLRFITRLSERTVHDVYPFFHRIESGDLYGAFGAEPEHNFRSTHSRREFRQWQWKRIHLAIHQCVHIAGNSRLLMGWAAHERKANWRSFPDELRKGLRDFQVSCLHSRTAAFSVRLRLRFWLIRMALFPFLPVPSFSNITSHTAVLIGFYNTSESMAEVMSLAYGDENIHRKMLAVLGTVNLKFKR